MLISFASYHLWLHWRPTGLYLAQLFTDYEPGIHWLSGTDAERNYRHQQYPDLLSD